MSLSPRVSDDVFIHVPQATSTPNPPNGSATTRLIFFLTGNPGLLSYYHEYLALLAASKEAQGYAIVGLSLGGFEGTDLTEADEELLFPDAVAATRSAKRRGEQRAWWGLEEQVELVVARVDDVVGRLRGGDGDKGTKVTLMGHSVGAFLALEAVRRVWERRERLSEPVEDAGGVLGVGAEQGGVPAWDVEACVLLAPTITDLALSPTGVKAAWLMGRLAFLPLLAQAAVDGLTWTLSEGTIRWMVARFMGLDSEVEGVKTTTRFLRSAGGVRQALEMAKQELVSITADNWGEEVWGSGKPVDNGEWAGKGGPQLYFLFAKTDHWVADKTRDSILSTRGRTDGFGAFRVDGEGLVHAWCLRQNRLVCAYVKPWLDHIRHSDAQ